GFELPAGCWPRFLKFSFINRSLGEEQTGDTTS
ncbi:MAG: hypothetical protein ACI9UK_002323, partial [Candidatus Krumholzibacteriia bacterium]